METELISQRDFHLLGIDIRKTLLLSREHRTYPGKDYLDAQYNLYCKLIESSNTLAKEIEDKLYKLPIE
jgi:hypothetical protein